VRYQGPRSGYQLDDADGRRGAQVYHDLDIQVLRATTRPAACVSSFLNASTIQCIYSSFLYTCISLPDFRCYRLKTPLRISSAIAQVSIPKCHFRIPIAKHHRYRYILPRIPLPGSLIPYPAPRLEYPIPSHPIPSHPITYHPFPSHPILLIPSTPLRSSSRTMEAYIARAGRGGRSSARQTGEIESLPQPAEMRTREDAGYHNGKRRKEGVSGGWVRYVRGWEEKAG